MQQLITAMQEQLLQLRNVLLLSGQENYTRPSRYNSGATIGQHNRHIIELLECLVNGCELGTVNYDERQRSKLLETDISSATTRIDELIQKVRREDQSLQLVAVYGAGEDEPVRMPTTYLRELAYNLEHTIHHMALLKTAFIEFSIGIIDKNFGVAYSTQQYRESCAQ